MTYLRTGGVRPFFVILLKHYTDFRLGSTIAAGENSSINVHGYSEVVGES